MTIKQTVKQNKLGQYFTKNEILREKVFEFILNNPTNILESSIGQGHLVDFVLKKNPHITFDMYEIDPKIELLDSIEKDKVVYCDFITQKIEKKYSTIIGNPPYIRTKTGNLYIDFTEKCYDLLNNGGELIFIVPSDFFKLTSASKLLSKMLNNGTFSHIFHPHNEKMFENANIDVIVFRYLKDHLAEKKVLYNEELLYIKNKNGLITFESEEACDYVAFEEYFNVYVGLVSGKEEVYKNDKLGNISVLNGENKLEKYIYIEKYPSENEEINNYLVMHKKILIERKIRKFNEKNWFEWGAPRNINSIRENIGKECIYIHNLTRKTIVAFVGKVAYFGGSLLMLIPKKTCNLDNIVSYMNSNKFKDKFMFSGRFKISHHSITNSSIPEEYLF